MVGLDRPQPTVGLIDRYFEFRLLGPDAAEWDRRAASVLGLESSGFEPIESEHFGYEETLTLFDCDRLDRSRDRGTCSISGSVRMGAWLARVESGRLTRSPSTESFDVAVVWRDGWEGSLSSRTRR